jgi:hypothetical protein
MARNIAALFNVFAGREVRMREIVHEWQDVDVRTEAEKKAKPLPVHKCSEWALADENDPLIGEMKQLAKSNDLDLKLWWPGKPGRADNDSYINPRRLTARIERGNDGRWRIGHRFRPG